MTAEEVLALAGFHVDDTIEFEYGGKDWLNEALNKLGKEALQVYTLVLDAEPMIYYPLPENCLSVDEVRVEGRLYEGYEEFGGRIRFACAGQYTVTYREMVEEVVAVTDTIQIHPLFKSALSLFVASRYRSSDADSDPEELADANRLMEDFSREMVRVIGTLRRQAKRPSEIKVQRSAG